MIKKSFAKINLYLEVTGRSGDYHLLNSLMAFLDIYDEIEFKESKDLELEIKGPYAEFLKNDEHENIIIRAVKILANEYKFDPKIKISLIKNIPIGGGIGGGSSNAATALLMLNEFYNLKISKTKLAEIGLKLGADVPFCLNQKMALISGIGENVSDIKIDPSLLFAIIVNPNIHLSTKEVFQNLGRNNQPFSKLKSENISAENFISTIKNHKNDLENSAIELAPEISQILTEITKQNNCLISRMSGSGSTCFGLFDNQNDLDLAYQNLSKNFPGFYLKKSKILFEL
jgi:4-diphosphocytidyl-2-C-methyl-D-erythritol kinase